MQRVTWSGLKVSREFSEFIEMEALPGTGVHAGGFWQDLSDILRDLGPKNRALLAVRDRMQGQIDTWHRENALPEAATAYVAFLREIGYLVDPGPDFAISTEGVDPEIATMAGPQLVVPVMNARYSLNAANARWGSLYDALYGTDAIPDNNGREGGPGYNPARGAAVVAWVRDFLDRSVPLSGASWTAVRGFAVEGGALSIALRDGRRTGLQRPDQFVGYLGETDAPRQFLLQNNGLMIEVLIDETTTVGATDPAHISDVWLEAALTVIADLEDSIAAVDAADKVAAYRNWLGLMKGDLSEPVTKGGRSFVRRLNPDLDYTAPDDSSFRLRCTALLLVRNVGHLMTTPAVLDETGAEVPEGILDAMVTGLIGLHDVGPEGRRFNSRTGSIYVVKPKMHGPDEVAFACEVFDRVEAALGMVPGTVKIGIMDEERRTTVNLKACIRAAEDRVCFINTGFLDRTGDEIHTSMLAGPVARKAEMRGSVWLPAYEAQNVDIGLACGLPGRAQIGKGMWAMPDRMAAMLAEKGGQLRAGASTAWVPSPTAAVLHATHYHEVSVPAVQAELRGRAPARVEDILVPPLAAGTNWSPEDVQRELDTNAQSMLGYVVRWIDQGVGCSKVPDLDDVGLMEDRATLRISSQHIANWLLHGICSRDQVLDTLHRMAAVVDAQNAGDPLYRPMAPDPGASIAFQAACDLVFEGTRQPNGYTEPILHARRLERKRLDAEARGAV